MAATSDGRLRRSERSREAIVGALLGLVGEGELRPTAQQVAERAGVGIRTVFRHFSDMDTLFDEMNAQLRGQLLPMLAAAPPAGDLQERARELAARRAEVFERIAPYKRAGNLQRWRSSYLRKEHAELARELRADLRRWLPEVAGAAEDLVDALDCAASFEAWDRLRSEQHLGRKRAAAALERAVIALATQLKS